MRFPDPTPERNLTAQHKSRIGLSIMLSLAVHGFIVSLEFGMPGFGLPDIRMPWKERRAAPQELQIVLAKPRFTPPPVPLPESVKEMTTTASAQPATGPQKKTVQAKTLQAIPALPHAGKSKSTLVKPSARKATKADRPATDPKIAGPRSQHKLITRATENDTAFAVTPPDPDVLTKEASSAPDEPYLVATPVNELSAALPPEHPPETAAEQIPLPEPVPDALAARAMPPPEAPAIAETTAPSEEAPNRQAEPDALATAERATLEREKDHAQLAIQRHAEENARQHQAALAAQQQEIQRRDQEEALRQTLAQEEQRRADIAKQQAERDLIALEAKRKEQERQQAELTRRKQEDQAALAAQQRENERVARTATAEPTTTDTDNKPRIAPLFRNLPGSSLASRALEQVRRPPLPEAEARHSPRSPDREENARRSVFGSNDRDIGLTMYVENWRRKIERNGNLNYAQSSKEKAGSSPIVTVAIRSDGSVEDIVINRSSGRPELDDAVRRIVQLNARYAVFPAALARKYDVIEVRKIWNFDDTLRLLEEVR